MLWIFIRDLRGCQFLFKGQLQNQAFQRIGVRDGFVEHGSQAELREAYGLTGDAVIAEAARLCSQGRHLFPMLFNGIRSRLEKIV